MAELPKNPRSTCYFGCKEGGPLHHFPMPNRYLERFNDWKAVLDNVTKEKGDMYIYNQLRLCNKHFENYYVLPSNRLTRNAVPTLCIKEDISVCSKVDVQPSTSAEVDVQPSTSAEVDVQPSTSAEVDVQPSTSAEVDVQPSTSAEVDVQPSTSAEVDVQPSTSAEVDVQPSTSAEVDVQPSTSAEVDVQPSTSAELRPVSASFIAEKDSNKTLKRKSMMSTGLTKQNHLKAIKRLSQRVLKLTQKCKTQTKKIRVAKKLSESKSFMKIIETMPDSVKTFMTMQLKSKKKAKGRKFTLEEKIMAASIYKQSQKGYNFLRNLIVLPSKRTLRRLLSAFKIKPGVNEKVIQQLEETVKKLPLEKRLYTLLFDEVALSPGLYFDKKEITGFENFGDKKTQNIADHALVFMIKGVKSKTKQPILFTFCKSTTKKYDLKKIIVETVQQLRKAGIIIIATICDQATANVSAIKMLQKETRENYLRENKEYNSNAFEVDDLKIFPLFDTPHLLKGVRNNFLTKNIKYKHENKVKFAKWEHLRMLLNEDRGEDEVRILNKLTEYHVDPEKLPKMKVKYASQVFSQRVSAVMKFLSKRKILPAECEDTADLLLIFDKLFDSFNGHSYHDTAKVLKGCLKKNSLHFQFWDETIIILKTIEFEKIVKNRNGTETTKYEKVPSVQNWIHNINTFKEMWKYINEKFKVTNILTRNFNQDPLENFFCCIRSNGIRNVNPTCMQFMNAYKTLLINNMNSSHSIGANCENDDYQLLQSMNLLLTDKCDSDHSDFQCEIDSLITTMNEIITNNSILHEEAKKYVAGYVIKKCKTKIFKKCKHCLNNLLKSEIDPASFNYMIDYTKKSLFNACDDFVKLLNEIYFTIVACLRDSPEFTNLKDKIVFFINCRCDFSIITCRKHKLVLVDYLINLSINLIVHSWCANVNRILIGKVINFDKNDKIKLQAFNYNKIHRKHK